MSPPAPPSRSPDWGALYNAAEVQAGYFTLAQAQACGYSSQALHKHLKRQRVERVRRGIYRLTHFPATANEELVALWLWSEQEGVFSHETSLALHDLSDALPAKVHMSLPTSWRARRLRVPDGLVLHYADLTTEQCTWLDAVPLTGAGQVLAECIDSHVSPEWIEQGIQQATHRGLITRRESKRLKRLLAKSIDESK